MLYLYWRVIFGELVKPALATIKDLSLREAAILVPLVVATLIMGVYPKFVFDITSTSVAHLIQQHNAALAYDRNPSPERGGSGFAQQIPGRGHDPLRLVALRLGTSPLQGEEKKGLAP
jgi:hypothetical protein